MLLWKEGAASGTTFVLPTGRTVPIGRDICCAVSIYDRSLSRQHCVLKPDQDGRWCLFDPGSSNGSHLNGKQVAHAVLRHGDQLRLGAIDLIFYRGDAGDPAVADLESMRLAVAKKLISLESRPDFLVELVGHPLQPWRRGTRIMVLDRIEVEGAMIDAFTLGDLVWPDDPNDLRERVRVRFTRAPEPIDLKPRQVAVFVPEIEPIDYTAGQLGGAIPVDSQVWGEGHLVLRADGEVAGQALSMGQGGQIDFDRFDGSEEALPVRFTGTDATLDVPVERLSRVIDEFVRLA